jgi:hypothetical protein
MSNQAITLTPEDCANLLDALQEWADVVGPKCLKKTKWGLMTLASPLLPTNSKESDRESRTNRIA